MRAMRVRSILVPIALLAGCSDLHQEVKNDAVTSAAVGQMDTLWELADTPDVELESDSGPALFYRIAGVVALPNGSIVVANAGTEEVRFFSAAGAYLTSAGGKGHGPGEFDGLQWIASTGDSLLIHDSGNDRISVVDFNGQYARSYTLEWHSGIVTPIAALPDGRTFASTARNITEMPHAGVVTDSALIALYGSDGAMIDSLRRLPDNQRMVRREGNLQTTLSLPFSMGALTASVPDGVCRVFGIDPEIHCITPTGATLRRIHLESEPVRVTQKHIDAYWKSALSSPDPRTVRAVQRMRDAMIFPSEFPAFANLVADDTGKLWVERYPQPGAKGLQWIVFQGEKQIATLEAPRQFQIRAVAKKRAIGIWRDSLGVESVRAYRYLTANASH